MMNIGKGKGKEKEKEKETKNTKESTVELDVEQVNDKKPKQEDGKVKPVKLKKDHKHAGKMFKAGDNLEKLGDLEARQVIFMKNNGII